MSVFVILIAGLLGCLIRQDSYLTRRIGGINLSSYKYGVFLSQPDSGIYYNVSPYNAYIVNDPRQKSVFEDFGIQASESSNEIENSLRNNYYLMFWDKKRDSLEFFLMDPLRKRLFTALNYFELVNPSATFFNKGQEIKITTQSQDGVVTFLLSTNPPIQKKLGFALTLADEDIYIDSKNHVFTITSEFKGDRILNSENLNDKLRDLSHLPLLTIDSDYLYIVNPHMNVALKIFIDKTLVEHVFIENQYKRLNFEFKPNTNPLIRVEIVGAYKEVLKNL